MIPKPPITADLLDDQWYLATREAMNQREGVPVRASKSSPAIEVYSINRGVYMPLMLPGGGTAFTTAEERDGVLKRLEGA